MLILFDGFDADVLPVTLVFENDDAVTTEAKACIEEFSVRRKMDIRGTTRIQAVGFDNLFFSQGASGIIENSDFAGQLTNHV